MNIGKIFFASVISVMTMFSASAEGEPGLITLKSGEQIEAPEVWYTHGQAIYLMDSKSQKVVIDDSEVAYVQFYDDEEKDYGPKTYSESFVTCLEFLKDNPKPKWKKSGIYKLAEFNGYVLYTTAPYHIWKKYGRLIDGETVYTCIKKPGWPYMVDIWPLRQVKMKKCKNFWLKMLEGNSTMIKMLQENPKEFSDSYYENAKGDNILMYISLFKDYVETLDKK